MPLTSQVGRDQIISSTLRPCFAGGNGEADIAEEFAFVEIEIAPLRGDFLGQFLDAVVKAGQRHRAVGIMQIGEDAREHADRIDRRAAVKARMQVAVGAAQDHFFEHQAAQHGGDRRRLLVPHAGVANQHDVGFELAGVLGHEGGQRGRAGFLLAFKQNADVAGQAAGLAEGAAGLDEGHQLAFVVGRAARHDALAGIGLDQPRLERRRLPEVQGVGRLHVVMAVEKNMGRVAPLRLGARDAPSGAPWSGAWTPRSRGLPIRAPASRRRFRNRENGRDRRRSREWRAARTGAPRRLSDWRQFSRERRRAVDMKGSSGHRWR